jgi:hybrid cluster-associated redox disulfide protein
MGRDIGHYPLRIIVETITWMNISEKLPDMTIEAVLDGWPETAVVFQHYHLACVGCVMAPFCKVSDAINIYKLPSEQFIADLVEAIPHDPIDTKQPGQHVHT